MNLIHESMMVPSKHRTAFSTCLLSVKLFLFFIASLITFLVLIELQVLKHPAAWSFPFRPPPRAGPLEFVPLKNISLAATAATAMDGNTWFMSAINDTYEPGETQYLHFPSGPSDGRILCVSGNDMRNGTRNGYALARRDALQEDARFYRGLTFVSDTYFGHENIWHGLSAVVPFVAWRARKGCEAVPARWVLYYHGEVRSGVSPWVGSVIEATFGRKAEVESFEGRGGGVPNCFEEAVVFRHNEGMMSRERREETYATIRCKARAYCNISRAVDRRAVRLTLLLRTGARSFKDDGAVTAIYDRECRKVDRCRLTVAYPNNLTFCEQVELMSTTDVLASPHGAQLTNMFLMDRNSSVMEFFPRGWKELAGPGQYVYHWIANWSGMRHTGAWRDPDGKECPSPGDKKKCFLFYKDGRIGHDEGYFGNWTANVLREMKGYKLQEESRKDQGSSDSCPCS